jgi:histidinol-phosphate aminotransferase
MASGLSRRHFMRMAGVATALPLLGEARLAMAQVPAAAADHAAPKTWINANEHPEGPCAAARAALGDMIPLGGRYLFEQTGRMVETCARHLGLRTDHALPYAGSSEPLHYGVLAFTSAKRGLVTANPTFEAAWEAAAFTRARVAKVALAEDGAHDLRRMVAADRRAGLVYVCNPNNPTGTITPRAEIEWALAHMPRDAVMMVDEAYIEYGDERSVVDLVAAGADLIVLRTFSKIYGMAGVRCGLALARPDLLKRLEYFGANPMPVAATAAAIASLGDAGLVSDRRRENTAVREETFAWLRAQGYRFTPSTTNCFLLDAGQPGKPVMAAMAARGVVIGRTWEILPNQVRITVGSRDEMLRYRAAWHEVMREGVKAAATVDRDPFDPLQRFTRLS